MMQNNGAGFLSGAAGGFFGSLGATAWGGAGGEWEGIGGKYANSPVGTIAFGALSGGVGAELSGGNFWKGAIAGGIVAGLNDVMHKMHSSVRVYDDDGEYVGKIKVLKYKNTGDGVEIELGFKAARNSKYTNYNWVQTVRTNHPLGGTSQTYTDPRPNDDNLPFYYTNSELAGQTNTSRGYNVEFYDSPSRGGIRNSWWKGELSLVGKFNNTYHQLHTFSYGFDMRNYQFFVAPLMTVNPSKRQLNTF